LGLSTRLRNFNVYWKTKIAKTNSATLPVYRVALTEIHRDKCTV